MHFDKQLYIRSLLNGSHIQMDFTHLKETYFKNSNNRILVDGEASAYYPSPNCLFFKRTRKGIMDPILGNYGIASESNMSPRIYDYLNTHTVREVMYDEDLPFEVFTFLIEYILEVGSVNYRKSPKELHLGQSPLLYELDIIPSMKLYNRVKSLRLVDVVQLLIAQGFESL